MDLRESMIKMEMKRLMIDKEKRLPLEKEDTREFMIKMEWKRSMT